MDDTEIVNKSEDEVQKKPRQKKFYEKGSLTIEAIISFTVFLAVSFLMLQLVKLTMVSLVLNSCTQETAKQLATSCYPIVMVNEVISNVGDKLDNVTTEISTSVNDAMKNYSSDDKLSSVMGTEEESDSNASALLQKLADLANDGVMSIFRGLKGKAGIGITAKIMDGYLDSSGFAFDKSKVVFRIVQLPLTDGEYSSFNGYTVKGQKNDLVLKPSSDSEGMDGDFNRDDVIVCAEYDYKIVLPMIPSISLKLRSTAVEHAWLGGCSSTTVRTEGLGDKPLDSVYKTASGKGKAYHKKDCDTLKRSVKLVEMTREEAEKEGLRACRRCHP